MRSIHDHFEQRRAEFRRYSSGALRDDEIEAMFRLAPDEQAGLILGRIPLDTEAAVQVFERVVLDVQGDAPSSSTALCVERSTTEQAST